MRVGPLIPCISLLRARGVDPARVFAEAGLAMATLDDPDNVIPYATLGRVLASCVRVTGLPDWGLRLGMVVGAPSLGVVGLLVENSPNLASALHNLVEHLHLHDRGGGPTLCVDGGVVSLGYAIHQDTVQGRDTISDAALAIGCTMLRKLCGPMFSLSGASLTHPAPLDALPYDNYFGVAVEFGAEENLLRFPARWLSHRLDGADERLRATLERQLHASSEQPSGSAQHMRKVLHTLLQTGEATQERLAQLFAMHRRTINRRLQAEGTTFRELVDEVRYEVARTLLESTGKPVAAIAGMLNYADASAFTRAFRRWSGTTPAQWRTQHVVTARVAAQS